MGHTDLDDVERALGLLRLVRSALSDLKANEGYFDAYTIDAMMSIIDEVCDLIAGRADE